MLRDNIFSNITGNYISRPVGIRRIYFFWPLLLHYRIPSDIGTMQRESSSSSYLILLIRWQEIISLPFYDPTSKAIKCIRLPKLSDWWKELLEKSKTQETEPSSNRIANHSRQQVQIYTNATPLTYLICDCPFSTSKTVMQEIEITHIKGPIRRDTLNFF
jgi:hypothetical protein